MFRETTSTHPLLREKAKVHSNEVQNHVRDGNQNETREKHVHSSKANAPEENHKQRFAII